MVKVEDFRISDFFFHFSIPPHPRSLTANAPEKPSAPHKERIVFQIIMFQVLCQFLGVYGKVIRNPQALSRFVEIMECRPNIIQGFGVAKTPSNNGYKIDYSSLCEGNQLRTGGANKKYC